MVVKIKKKSLKPVKKGLPKAKAAAKAKKGLPKAKKALKRKARKR